MTEDKKQKTSAAEQADSAATQESGKQADDKERSACGRARESAKPADGDESVKPEEGHAAETENAAPVRAVFGVSADSGVDHRPAYGKDKYSFLWGLLSFFAPVVAFALRNLWRRTYPLRSKSILIGSVLGIVFYVALFATAVALIVVKINLYKP